MTIKKGLGRGLSALIPDADMDFLSSIARGEAPAIVPSQAKISLEEPAAPTAVAEAGPDANANTADTTPSGDSIEWVQLGDVTPNPYQPRRSFSVDELQELTDSIKEHGILQPILLRPSHAGENGTKYELVAGERRWRAAQQAGLEKIPAIIREVADQQALELAIIENVQRHDISAIDTAIAYRRLASEFKLSQEDIARRVGKSRSAIANTMRLLDLPEEIRKAIEDGAISEGHGRAILTATGEAARRAIFRRVLRDKLSVRETERIAQTSNEAARIGGAEGAKSTTEKGAFSAAEILDMAEHLKKVLGTRLNIKSTGNRGVISVEFSSEEELERLYQLILSLRR